MVKSNMGSSKNKNRSRWDLRANLKKSGKKKIRQEGKRIIKNKDY